MLPSISSRPGKLSTANVDDQVRILGRIGTVLLITTDPELTHPPVKYDSLLFDLKQIQREADPNNCATLSKSKLKLSLCLTN
jgi:hypothetical protein